MPATRIPPPTRLSLCAASDCGTSPQTRKPTRAPTRDDIWSLARNTASIFSPASTQSRTEDAPQPKGCEKDQGLGFNLKQIAALSFPHTPRAAPRPSRSRNLIRRARCRPSRLQSRPLVLNPIPAKSFFASKHYHTLDPAGLGVVRAVQPSQLTTRSQPLVWVKGSYQNAM